MKNLILLISVLLLTSCYDNIKEVSPPYYQFIEEDLDKLLTYEVDQIITYKNENNEERKYIVTSVETEKEDYGCCATFGPPSPYTVFYYYDIKKIEFQKFPNGGDYWYYYFTRKPPFVSEPDVISKFYGSINEFPFWNGQLSDGDYSYINYYSVIDYNQTPILMEVNGHEFSKVHIVNSDNPDIDNSNVNVIYFDEVEGIIGFDDLENNKWRIVI